MSSLIAQSFEADGDLSNDPTVSAYHASRARYIRTFTSDIEKRLNDTIGRRRAPLAEEITNMTVLAHHRFDAYQVALKAYASKAPGRVTATGIVSPSPADRLGHNVDKLYKAAIKAAEEYRECETIIKKRKAKLVEIDYKMKTQIEQYGRDLIAQLETPVGLQSAFKRDPLLGRAHALMTAAQARRASVLKHTPRGL